ncbi:hypothetical protein IE077_003295 [Cardiosporidium cionae]|uniref:GCF C-terminal domain-containing protein n=1 Tax=Cardiosporidium cionae TaxID=476202 RepID=A0ABQ7J8M3_9APIC|nr:hypothetical protein IE077_003295 [Cardiosporidium cionae]|eukprot:KAF8820320.1 hypothetical protein IE077_003295 [Cardiosporidium cionae]
MSCFSLFPADLEVKYEQMSEMNAFLHDLNGLFASKRQPIEKAHQTLLSMERGLSERIWTRKIQDAEELYALALPTSSPLEKDEVDEFGRSKRFASSVARKERAVRRAARLKRRSERSLSVKEGPPSVHTLGGNISSSLSIEGWVSSEESDEEKAKSTLFEDRLIFSQAALDIFNDVADHYKDMDQILGTLLRFKETFPSEYAKLFTPDALLSLLEPFILWQMLWWDPLNLTSNTLSSLEATTEITHASSEGKMKPMKILTVTTLEAFHWYQSLVHFLLQQETSSSLHDEKEFSKEIYKNSKEISTEDLLVKVVQKTVYPRVKEWISLWDISSLQQSKRLASLMQEMLLFRDSNFMEDVASLLTTLVNRMQIAVESILLDGNLSKLSSSSANRYLWQTVKIASCFLQFVDILSDEVLKDIVFMKLYAHRLSKLLNCQICEHLDIFEQFLMVLPSSWLTSASMSPPLVECIALLHAFARFHSSSSMAMKSSSTPSSIISRCVKLLQRLQVVSVRLFPLDEARSMET